MEYQKAKQILIESGLLHTFERCPICESEDITSIRRDKYLCRAKNCRYEWGIKKDSLLEHKNTSLVLFIYIVKAFSQEPIVSIACKKYNLPYITTSEYYKLFREKLFQQDLYNQTKSYQEKIKQGRPPQFYSYYFGIKKNSNKIKIHYLGDSMGLDDLLPYFLYRRKQKIGDIIFYKGDEHYKCGYFFYQEKRRREYELKITYLMPYHNIAFFNSDKNAFDFDRNNYILKDDSIKFYKYLIQYKKLFKMEDTETASMNLSEIEFRYNTRNQDVFSIVLNKLSKMHRKSLLINK